MGFCKRLRQCCEQKIFILSKMVFSLCLQEKISMDLKMFIKGQLIDTRVINILKLNSFPGYIHSLKMDMEDEHEDVIDLSNEEPQFFIDHVPSSMNNSNTPFKN